jgi:hypothetical protein
MNTVRTLDAKRIVHKFNIAEVCFTDSYTINGSLKCVSTHFIYPNITTNLITIKSYKTVVPDYVPRSDDRTIKEYGKFQQPQK